MATPNAQRSTQQWQALDSRHYLHPFSNHRALSGKGSRIITRADGVYLWDSDGRKILDGMAGLWCVNVGYGRNELAEAAYRQLQRLPYYNSFFQSAHPPSIELSARLAGITPAGLDHVFFVNSGSEANDTVVRLARRHWDIAGKPHKRIIVSRVNAYHGSTVASASLGGMKPMHEQGGLPIPDVVHIDQPYYFDSASALSPQQFGLQTARALEAEIERHGADRVAAFIAEPIQGAGGVIIPPDSYWPEIQRICRRHDVLLVADEVICGFGRTGEWFGCDYYAIEPDLMPIAKGLSSGYLPIGGVMIGEKVAATVLDHDSEFFHGFTYSGHPAACAVALANIDILHSEGIIERVRDDSGPYLREQWSTLADHPLVGETRALGLLGALELVRDKSAPVPRRPRFEPVGDVGALCRDFSIEQGLVMRAVGDTMVIAPPLVIDRAQIDELVEKTRQALDLTAQHLKL